jgi:hypothetical protein
MIRDHSKVLMGISAGIPQIHQSTGFFMKSLGYWNHHTIMNLASSSNQNLGLDSIRTTLIKLYQ